MIAIVAAIANNNVIGKRGALPWYLPEDLKRFKKLTVGHTVIMGRKTYESIVDRLGKPLPDRLNVVISRSDDFKPAEGVEVFSELKAALAAHQNDEKVFLIGGAQLWEEGIQYTDTLHITHIHQNYDGDVFFPQINWSYWQKISEEPHEEFTFTEYRKLAKIKDKLTDQLANIKKVLTPQPKLDARPN
jgi:dihydrofolate reductase